MPSTTMRRPLPALIFLIGLTLLAALVWWRVLSRNHHSASPASHCSSSPSTTAPKTVPAPGAVAVLVLNSTQRTGLASTVRTTLLHDGFRSPQAARNDTASRGRIAGVAEIRYAPGLASAAKLLQYYLPGATLRPVAASGGTVVVSLGNAFRAVATPAAVHEAMARDHVTQTGAPAPASSTPVGSVSSSASC
jgi:hypothetical protein